MRRIVRACLFSALLWAPASEAAAELVFFATGRTMSVSAHRIDGGTIVLSLRGGGEIICDRSLVDRIVPDEVPLLPNPLQGGRGESGGGQAAPLPADPLPFSEEIATASARYGVDPALVHAVIRVESDYRPDARSHKGAMGLMQLMPSTARQYAVRNPYEPLANMEAGIQHLRSLLDRFELSLALAAYNAGEATVRRFGGIPPYPETRSYVRHVLQLFRAAAR